MSRPSTTQIPASPLPPTDGGHLKRTIALFALWMGAVTFITKIEHDPFFIALQSALLTVLLVAANANVVFKADSVLWPAADLTGRKKTMLQRVVVVLVLTTVGYGLVKSVDWPPPKDAPSSKAASGPSPPTRWAKLGQPIQDDRFQITVRKIDCGDTEISDDVTSRTANGTYCKVAVTVKNVATKALAFDDAQKAIGAGGATYDNDPEAEACANHGAQTFPNRINPGNEATGVLVFDVPHGATIMGLELFESSSSPGVTVVDSV